MLAPVPGRVEVAAGVVAGVVEGAGDGAVVAGVVVAGVVVFGVVAAGVVGAAVAGAGGDGRPAPAIASLMPVRRFCSDCSCACRRAVRAAPGSGKSAVGFSVVLRTRSA